MVTVGSREREQRAERICDFKYEKQTDWAVYLPRFSLCWQRREHSKVESLPDNVIVAQIEEVFAHQRCLAQVTDG